MTLADQVRSGFYARKSAAELAEARERIERECTMAGEVLRRVQKIALRVYPATPTPHGFEDPLGFIGAASLTGQRNRFCREITPRIEAKVRAKFGRTNHDA